MQEKYDVSINNDLLNALINNNLNSYLIELSLIDNKLEKIPVYTGSFESAFIKASKELGIGKSIYFEWYGNIYTTELAP